MKKKFYSIFAQVFKLFPAFYAERFALIALGGAVIVLAFGIALFYQNGPRVVADTYEVPPSRKIVNTKNLQDSIGFLKARKSAISLPANDPFAR